MSALDPGGPAAAPKYVENKTYDEISVGDFASLTRILTPRDIELFAVMSGDVNPAHVDPDYAETDMFHHVIAHGMWGGALISTVLGTELPGPGTIFLTQSLAFKAPVALGDALVVRVEVTRKQHGGRVLLACTCTNQHGTLVMTGDAAVIAPRDKIHRPRVVLPEVHLHARGAKYAALIAAAKGAAPIRTAVAHPCDPLSLIGALDAARQGVIIPILIGPRAKIEAAAHAGARSLDGVEIIDTPHSHAAAAAAVALVRAGEAGALMQGSLDMDELMAAADDPAHGLRTERMMSHVCALDVPSHAKPLLITDAAINARPDLIAKRDIVQNAIDLARALGIALPKVAILCARETVSVRFASTLDAAALCKMASRGQIVGGLLDGPMAFDTAISRAAAAANGMASDVAGDADILVAPDLEAADMMVKQLVHLAGADAAGIVLGARAPIILIGRADSAMSRLASCALAQLFITRQGAALP